jgi:hypothetical protein
MALSKIKSEVMLLLWVSLCLQPKADIKSQGSLFARSKQKWRCCFVRRVVIIKSNAHCRQKFLQVLGSRTVNVILRTTLSLDSKDLAASLLPKSFFV